MAEYLKCNQVGPFFSLRCDRDAGHLDDHSYNEQHWVGGKRAGGITAVWHEPEPEKPREVFVCDHGTYVHSIMKTELRLCHCGEHPSGIHRRLHDADACDRRHETYREALHCGKHGTK
jgi:hypothetical protein